MMGRCLGAAAATRIKSAGVAGFLILAAGGASETCAQPTKEDSGWVSVFNGKDFSNGMYVYSNGWIDIADQAKFKVENGMIHAGGSYALLMTLKEYTHYKVRVDYMFGAGASGSANAGLMVLMDNTAAKTVKSSTRPRSIEVNCRRDNNYPWSLWAGRGYGPYMTTTVKAGTDQYLAKAEGGVPFTFNITADDNRVIRSTYPNTEKPPGQWNHGEAWVYGDSGVFHLNGQIRTASWGWVEKKDGKDVKTASGSVGVQTEGHDIWYRAWEIQELDPVTRLPLHATKGCTDPKSPRFNPRAVVEDGSCSGTISLAPGGIPGGAVQPLLPLRAVDGRLVPAFGNTRSRPAPGFYLPGAPP